MSKKLSQSQFEKIVDDKYNSKFCVVGEYIDAKTPVKIMHNDCKTIFERIPNSITPKNKNCSCPKCDGYSSARAIRGINDLWTTHNNFAKLLKNPEDGYLYSSGSNKSVEFVCPNCNNVLKNTICKVVNRGYISCKYCSDGVSYPNKFMANLLKELKVDFCSEYIIHPFKYKFDFYFCINFNQYIIEMDGGIGHGNKDIFGNRDYIGIKSDFNKDNICKNNNINIIRIDCNYSSDNRYEYIKNSILSSYLSVLFDLDNINFVEINKKSLESYVYKVSELWNQGFRLYEDYKNVVNKSRKTIREYIKRACLVNLIDCSYEEALKQIRSVTNKKNQTRNSVKIRCNQTGQVFESISEAKRVMKISNLHNYLNGKYSYCGKLKDGTKLTWTLI